MCVYLYIYVYMVQRRPAPPPQRGWVANLASYGSPPPPPVACGGEVFGMLVMGGMYVCR